jgi:uncharacterized protein with ATP-grasp and redox domains
LRTSLDCYPCFVRQALDAARQVSDDPAVHARVLRGVCQFCAELDLSHSPPAIGQQVHRIVRQLTGSSDPYRRVKERFNRLGMALRDRLRPRLAAASDPFDAALRLAIAGNSIDFGARSDLTEEDTTALMDQAFTRPLHGHTATLKHAAANAGRILFLADNTGEIALDMLLVEQLPLERTTVAVRGRPIINDATIEDARAVGLTELVTVIDNGSDAPGTLLDDCSPQFLDAMDRADLIISKGQGNYESLSGRGRRNIYYLLIPKCNLVANRIGCHLGGFVVRSGDEDDSPTPQGAIDEDCHTR